MSTRRRALIGGAALVSVAVLAVGAAAPAFTATADAPVTTVRKSVQILMDPSGVPQATRLYTQYQSTGNGAVSFTDATSGALRNLNGFGTPPVTDGKAQFSYNVNGLSNQRSLQDYPSGDLPITVKVTATLDGQSIAPNDVLGKSGLLVMTYTIENKTGVPQDITWTDGTGATQTKNEIVPLPYVGSFSTTLPDSYADISAPGASMGGTGQNSVQLSYNLLLYKPLGDTTATITYQARVTNAEIPQVDMTFLPAGPGENASTKALQDQIKGGQDAGVQITDAGTQIDANLLKLAAGAGQLNAGLAQLQTGAVQLADGLNNTAVPGTQKLAAGANDLATGLNDTAVPGSKKLAVGSAAVAVGATSAASGADKLAAGSTQVSGGSTDLASSLKTFNAGMQQLSAGIKALPTSIKTEPGYQQLLGALAAVQNGIGLPTSTSSLQLNGGMNLIRAGLDNPAINFPASTGPCNSAAAQGASGYCGLKDALQLLDFGLNNPGCNPADPTNPANPCGAVQGVGGVKAGLDAALVPTTGSIAQLDGAVGAALTLCTTIAASSTDATSKAQAAGCVSYLTAANAGIVGAGGLHDQTAQASAALGLVSAGLTGQALPGIAHMVAGIGTDATAGTLLNGTALVKGGLYNAPLPVSAANPAGCDSAAAAGSPTSCGIYQVMTLVSGGIGQLVQQISDGLMANVGSSAAGCNPNTQLACASAALASGATTLSGGASQVASGNQDLAKGLATLSSGADQVAAGNKDLSTGLVTAADGATQVADGATQVATGIAPAAAGATQISDGLTQAVPGGTQIEDGANQLSEQGSKKLIESGNTTTNSYGEQYALMQALNTRSATLAGVPNGPATGTNVVSSGAFGYTLDGVTKSDTTNGLRFLLAALLLAAAVGFGVMFARD